MRIHVDPDQQHWQKHIKNHSIKVKLKMFQNQDKGTAIPKVYVCIVPVPYLYRRVRT